MTPFEFVDSINSKEQYLMRDEVDERDYNPFIVNRALSNTLDTLFFAVEMNKYPDLDKKMQYDFYFHGIEKGKRRAPWAKKEVDDDLQLVVDAYECSPRKAASILQLLTPEQLDQIRESRMTGGKEKKKSTK